LQFCRFYPSVIETQKCGGRSLNASSGPVFLIDGEHQSWSKKKWQQGMILHQFVDQSIAEKAKVSMRETYRWISNVCISETPIAMRERIVLIAF
jgi:hypothetical protein